MESDSRAARRMPLLWPQSFLRYHPCGGVSLPPNCEFYVVQRVGKCVRWHRIDVDRSSPMGGRECRSRRSQQPRSERRHDQCRVRGGESCGDSCSEQFCWKKVGKFFDRICLMTVGDEQGVGCLNDDEIIHAKQCDAGTGSGVEDDVIF